MDRRKFISLGGAALFQPAPASASSNPSSSPKQQETKPHPQSDKVNILMIMADQHRWDCLGVYGNKVIHTPNMDRIGNEGVVFDNAYSSTPTCTPARSALMTGRSPWGHGLLGYGDMATNPYPTEKAAAMAKAGYYTTAIGKNHYYSISNPHGYHHMLTHEHMNESFHSSSPEKAQSLQPRCDYESWFWSLLPDKDPVATGPGPNDRVSKEFVFSEEMHPTYWTGETAVRFLEQYDRQQPFFLKVSFMRPHSPYDPPKRFFDLYKDADIPKAQVGDWAKQFEPHASKRDDTWYGKFSDEEIRSSRQGYYGAVSFVDEQIGRILHVLEEREMLDNTMILYFSDHGDMLGDQNHWRKGFAYEASAHIPLMIRPAKNQKLQIEEKRIANPVEIRDLLPTFLDVAGAPVPSDVEGKSLLNLVRGDKEWRAYIDLEHDVLYSNENHWNALTDGEWKYVFHCYDGHEQLFRLPTDRYELTNLSGNPEHEEQLSLWRSRMVEHMKIRGPVWVNDGKLQLRKGRNHFSPNFPGYSAILAPESA